MFKRILWIFLICQVGVGAQDKPRVLCSFSILGDVVSQVVKDLATVDVIVGPNQDTHVFEPTPETTQKILRADVVFINGLHFETWVERVIKAANYTKGVHAVSALLQPLWISGSQGRQLPDPHVWGDPRNVMLWVDVIEKQLVILWPHHADRLHRQADRYREVLKALDQRIRQEFSAPKHAGCKIITAHDAFGYFGHAYNVTFLAPQGLSTASEPSAFDMASVIDVIRKQNVKAIFVENLNNQKLIQQIAQETGVRIGGTLLSDALSPPPHVGSTYVGMMLYNTFTLTQQLGCWEEKTP
jgi:zinc/manganese transport system substrate-binding protein